MRKIAVLLFLLGFLTPWANAAVAASCDSLRSMALDHATITAAAVVEAGALTTRDAGPTPAGTFTSLPGFCRVQGVITPSADSDIRFEVWLPMSGWNGKYEGVGNGGLAGSINYVDMAAAIRAGYATSSTDTGHQAPATNGQWGLGHPEKVIDYGYRAIHETAVKSKAIIEAFYDQGPRHSYFSSCSNGGRQALMEAQRFPEDYDGIIAGAPAANLTRIAQLYVSNTLVTTIDPASYIPASKFAAVAAAAVAACDAQDGVRDQIIDEPSKCTFDPAVLQCTENESDSCLTALQVAALKKIYGGLRAGSGEQLYPGFLPGGEAGPRGWAQWIAGPSPTRSSQHIFGIKGMPI